MDILKAKDIAKETAKLNNLFSQVMNLAIQLKEENDALKGERNEAQRLMLKNKAEARRVIAEDLKPALAFALCQRDVALRSVEKIHAIHKLVAEWNKNEEKGAGSVDADSDFIQDVKLILKTKILPLEKGAV